MNLKSFPVATLISFSSSQPSSYSFSIFISHFSTSRFQTFRSRPSLPRHEEESRHVKVSVWWDFENCQLPIGVNVFKIAHMITAAVRANGIKGPVRITAFGDIVQISRTNQEALSSTGINIAHIPNGGKNSADRSLLVDLMHWISQNPPPAHLFLISGDRDFASVLHKLRMNNYNVLLASPDSASSFLCSASSIMWNWKALLKGQNLIGKHYNQPPDGPYGSWYGHYKGPLEDPFLLNNNQHVPRLKKLSKGFSDSKLRPMPKAVIKQIRQILNSYPKGISISDFRSELIRSKVGLDKDLYGYKKFSHFLLSMPHILRLQSKHDGPFCKNGNRLTTSRAISNDMSVAGALNRKSRLHQYPEVEAGVTPKSVKQSPSKNVNLVKVNAESEKTLEEVEKPLPVGQKIPETSSNQATGSHQAAMLEQDSASEVSFIRKGWQRWLSDNNHNSETKSHDLPPTISTSTIENKVSGKANENQSVKRSGFFNWIVNWCKFWGSSQDSEMSSNLSCHSCEKNSHKNSNSLKHELFLRVSSGRTS